MDTKKRWMFLTVFTLSSIAVALLSTSLATNDWVLATPRRNVSKDTEAGALNVTGGDIGTKFKGRISFGLFRGYKELDHGLGVRSGPIEIKCSTSWNKCAWVDTGSQKEDYIDNIMEKYEAEKAAAVNGTGAPVSSPGLFSLGVWVACVVCVCVGVIWGLVAMAFSMLNVCTRPIDTITGPLGLYVWNICALLFCLLAIALYLALFFIDYQQNVLSPTDRNVYLWYSTDLASLNFSFYLVAVAGALFLANIIVVALGGTKCHWIHYGNNINEKSMEGVMMY